MFYLERNNKNLHKKVFIYNVLKTWNLGILLFYTYSNHQGISEARHSALFQPQTISQFKLKKHIFKKTRTLNIFKNKFTKKLLL